MRQRQRGWLGWCPTGALLRRDYLGICLRDLYGAELLDTTDIDRPETRC